MGNLKEKISKWYKGKKCWEEVEECVVEQGVEVLRNTDRHYTYYHWTAQIARWAVKEYKWIIGVLIAAVSAFAGAYVAFNNCP